MYSWVYNEVRLVYWIVEVVVLCMSNSNSDRESGSSVYSLIQADPKISVKNGSKLMGQSVYSTGWNA